MSHSTTSSEKTPFYKPPALNKTEANRDDEMSDDLFTLAVAVVYML